jgi:hypothetical protein
MSTSFHLVMALVFYAVAGGFMLVARSSWRAGDRMQAAVDGAFTLLMAMAAAIALAQALP